MGLLTQRQADRKPSSTNLDVQAEPVSINGPKKGSPLMLKVDEAFVVRGRVVVTGWTTIESDLELWIGDAVAARDVEFIRYRREDVNRHVGRNVGSVGFAIVVEAKDKGEAPLHFAWTVNGSKEHSSHLQVSTEPGSTVFPQSGQDALLDRCAGLEPFSASWKALAPLLPIAASAAESAHGFLEVAAATPQGEEAIVVGWVASSADKQVWLEAESGDVYSLESAFRFFRQDVFDSLANESGPDASQAGFIARLPGLQPGETIRLKALGAGGASVLGEYGVVRLSFEPTALATWLFSVNSPLTEKVRRFQLIDGPVIEKALLTAQERWGTLPTQTLQYGNPPGHPEVSVIVPLHGRLDFLEHQLMEFCRDEDFMNRAELIYVLDDPNLVEPFRLQALELQRLYQVPFRSVWGRFNRGFSGANNLGAEYSRGDKLLFLNSDAFPITPGWLGQLCEVLDSSSDVAALAPQLVFADGSLQHAGIEFQYREDLGVWINHHPYMGLDPALDPHTEVAMVPAVTGACLMMRREDFDSVCGWDTGYLVGDFEDSDLCCKLRERGQKVAYVPHVQLTHLERQSFQLLGAGDFRTQVTIFNALRHQKRWKHLLEGEVGI